MLNKYRQEGAYADCYFIDAPRLVSQAEFVEAFYTTPLFKVERLILSLFAGKPCSDLQAKQLACGEIVDFAAWSVEARTANQLLLCDYLGRTRSWLMSVPTEGHGATTTRLYFGSAVVPRRNASTGRTSMGVAFHALSGFHRLYSRMLLRAALSRLLARMPS
ncbi:MAG: hypothetical protein HY255_01330 [Betaproteobacteria bacterium]|nr:hypothetical protein [Betaproteobacteria bacterium]